MDHGLIHQLNISPGGVPKRPVDTATVDTTGLAGDGHRDEDHGGQDRAVCLLALEVIEALAADGHPIAPGTTGENVTVRGLDWARVVPGTQLHLGDEVRVEVTEYTTPCKTIAGSFQDGNFARVSQKAAPGYSRVYARVLRGGTVRPDDQVHLVD